MTPADPVLPAGFGRRMLDHWALDPAITYLNHGTVGAPPRRVLAAQQALRDEIERQPSQFLLRELTGIRIGASRHGEPRLREAAGAVAGFVGGRAEDLVFVDNTTSGVNAVLHSIDLRPGDELLLIDQGYGAVRIAAEHAARAAEAVVRRVELPELLSDPGEAADAIEGAVTARTRLAVIDHVTSDSALVLPIAEVARRLHAHGVAVLADGAHAPGAIPLDIPALGVDWYTGNLHKWGWAPRSSAILWASPDRQAELHPTVISWGLGQGLSQEFDMVGTRDPTPHLAAPAGIAFMRELGVERVQGYNHALAWQAGREMAAAWGTKIDRPESMVGTMIVVPLPERAGSTREQAMAMRDALLFEDRLEVHLHAWRGRLRARVSAQVYNEMADVERLIEAVRRRI